MKAVYCRFCFSIILPFLVRADGSVERSAFKGPEATRNKEKNTPRSVAFTGFTLFAEWFPVDAVSIWTWTGRATRGHWRGQLCHSAPLKTSPGVHYAVFFSVLVRPASSDRKAGATGAQLFTGPPWTALITLIAWPPSIQNHPCHTCSGYSSAEQFAPNLSGSFGVC